jgi:murein DD-endopeptidase MepM/ murein hydrolase activator NlpD
MIATAFSANGEDFCVMASAGGVVAFVGNTDPEGYGYSVVIDHGGGEYSLSAHLAEQASKAVGLKVGDILKAGQTIGYVYDPVTKEMSSGNASHTVGVQPWEHIQVHVELIVAKQAGLRPSVTAGLVKQFGATIVDPTPRLVGLGYK